MNKQLTNDSYAFTAKEHKVEYLLCYEKRESIFKVHALAKVCK